MAMADPRRARERDLQAYAADLLRVRGRSNVLHLHIANEGKRTRAYGGLLRRQGLLPGAADLLLVVDGRAHFLELKTDSGRQSDAQRSFERWAVAAGSVYAVARSPEEIEERLVLWGALRLNSVRDVVRLEQRRASNATGQSEATGTIPSGGGVAGNKASTRHKQSGSTGVQQD